MKRPLRALLLAGGLGTRLRPLTLHMPKCLVPINGEPLLGRWLRQLEKTGCDSVLVNTHHLAEQVEDYLQRWQSLTMEVSTVYEPVLLGTAGTLLANQQFFASSTGLLIHADNAMAEDLQPFLLAHQRRQPKCLLTMLTFITDKPSSCGIVEIGDHLIAKGFYEKTKNPPGNIANGALYAFEPVLLDHINGMESPPSDFSTEVLPSLLGRIQTWHTTKPFLDIGTPEALTTAQSLYRCFS